MLSGPGLRLRTGPVVTEIRSHIQSVAAGIALHYTEHTVESSDSFADFHVVVDPPRSLRRWVHPKVFFRFDGTPPFKPLPLAQAFPILEWGLNWCVSTHCHQYVILHAAVVARDDRAVILPAPSGSGKSTLCAGLVARGWRLLSDELALIDPTTTSISPLPRPISLKNESIEVIRRFVPDARLNAPVHDTLKGSVAHMQPPKASVRDASRLAYPVWIVVPHFAAGATAELKPLPKATAFMHLATASFNYDLHGRGGFSALADVIERSRCYEFSYSSLDDAARTFDQLALDQ
jgi:HprK-related kinase A